MPDITMCQGHGCEKKNECYRHTAKPNELRQSFFSTTPCKKDPDISPSGKLTSGGMRREVIDGFHCEYFWEDE